MILHFDEKEKGEWEEIIKGQEIDAKGNLHKRSKKKYLIFRGISPYFLLKLSPKLSNSWYYYYKGRCYMSPKKVLEKLI